MPQRAAEATGHVQELARAISEAGHDIGAALPLVDQLRQAIVQEADLRIQALQEQRQREIQVLEQVVEQYQAAVDVAQQVVDQWQAFVDAQQAIVDQAESQLDSLRPAARESLSPAAQAAQIRGEIAGLEAELATQTGAEALQTAEELQRLCAELGQIGETTDNLALIAEAQAGYEELIGIVEQQRDLAQYNVDAGTQQLQIAQQQLAAQQELLAWN